MLSSGELQISILLWMVLNLKISLHLCPGKVMIGNSLISLVCLYLIQFNLFLTLFLKVSGFHG